MNVIELKNIYFTYDADEDYVLKDLSLEVEQGECLIVQGDNGSGKSTLFRVLNGLSFPQEGSYSFDGTVIDAKYLKDNKNAKVFHKKLGYLFQNPDIMLFNASVYNEVAFGPRQMGMSDAEVDERVKECLGLFGIEDLSGKAPYHLSGGQKKKVAFASVIALNPEVLILDEPYAGLDKKSKAWLTEFLKAMKSAGKTLIIATHEKELAEELGDRVLEM